MSEHIETRNKLKSIYAVTTFEELLNQCTLNDTDKEILRLHYLQEKDYRYIGDMLGYSSETIRKRHKKALKKLGMMIK